MRRSSWLLYMFVAEIPRECKDCGFFLEHFSCPSIGKSTINRFETACVDCSVYLVAFPCEAVERIVDTVPRKQITISVDGQPFAVPKRVTVKRSLELLRLKFRKFPGRTEIFAPCETEVVLPVR
ncbi:MAG: hypothetical protein O2U62_06180 [Candidatus Bathyarchaeota archaeon]|nr:hypothetical protein [Candidatus Bathyarchaeota archaeon]